MSQSKCLLIKSRNKVTDEQEDSSISSICDAKEELIIHRNQLYIECLQY